MELRKFKIIGAAAIFTAVLALNSCQKEKALAPKVTESSTPVTEQNLNVVTTYNEVLTIIEAARSGRSFKTEDVLNDCAVITIDSISDPHTILVDFGTGCVSSDGIFRSGTMYAEFNVNSKQSFKATTGAYINATMSNYVVDDKRYNGPVNVTNDGPNVRGNLEFPVSMGVTIENIPAGTTASINSSTTFEWLTGSSTGTREDDQLSLIGTMNGVTKDGDSYTASQVTPIIINRAAGCDYPVSGEMQYQIGSGSVHYINYGTGTCDDEATETVDGNTTTIYLSQQ